MQAKHLRRNRVGLALTDVAIAIGVLAVLLAAVTSALGAVTGKSKDVIVILPDIAVRVMLLDFEALPEKPSEIEPVIRFRLKKSLPFDVDQTALSYSITRARRAGVRFAGRRYPTRKVEP